MGNVWHWIIVHWKGWGINGIVAGVASAITWVLARRKEWKEERREKAEQKLDSKVLKALGERTVWKGPRPTIIGGFPGVKSDEMAEYLQLDQDAVADSFERLEKRGRATRSKGTINDPGPWWYIVPR